MPSASSPIRSLMLFFAVAYTVEGICQAKVGILWQPLTYYLKETHGWTPLEVSASLAVLDVAWMVKPLYGLISDFVPLFGYRRRSYLLIANVVAIAAFIWAASVTATAMLIIALLLTAIAMAVSSTLCGALLVENGQRHGASARFVNQQWLWLNVAVMATSLLGGLLIEWLPPAGALHAAAWIAAVAPIALLVCLTLVHEERAPFDLPELRRRWNGLVAAFRSRALWFVALFLFLYYFNPGFGTPLYYHMTDRLHFSQGFIGALSAVNAAGWVAGGLFYKFALSEMRQPVLLRLSIVLGALSTLAFLALLNPALAVGIYFLAGVAAMIANIATLTLAADNCPQRAEGFAFAGLMSIINLATPLSDMLGALLYERVFASQLAPLIVVSAAFTAFVLLLVPMVEPARRTVRAAG